MALIRRITVKEGQVLKVEDWKKLPNRGWTWIIIIERTPEGFKSTISIIGHTERKFEGATIDEVTSTLDELQKVRYRAMFEKRANLDLSDLRKRYSGFQITEIR